MKAGLVGWRRSADRTRLQGNSLLTGNFTGKSAISRPRETFLKQETTVPQRFSDNSLLKLTGKIFRRTGNFCRITGNFIREERDAQIETKTISETRSMSTCLRFADLNQTVFKSEKCRFCCKSRKSKDPENLAKGDFQRAATLRSAITPLRRSVVVFSRNDVVPHVATCNTRQRP